MGKSDANQTKKRSHKAKATDGGEIKHKNKPSFDAMIFKATDNEEGPRHSKWQDLFRQLCEYKVQFGDCLVPRRYSTNPKLGNWVNYQRNRYKDNTEAKSTSTTAEHIRALNGIGFEWGTSQTEWSVRFQQLCEFKEQFGHCLVARQYSANPKLGRWVSTQRHDYKLYQEGKPSYITEERIRELESVGFEWETSASIWSVRFQQLREFTAQFGHCLVPQQYPDNPKLGVWAHTQRSHYRWHQEGKPSHMTEDRIRELESVGFKWEAIAFIWSVRFQQLREYKAQFGHYLVAQQYSANPKLGWWVKRQRHNYRLYQEGKPSPLTEERIRELESVEFK